jgi:5-formyltetrahydrofolate cyclo-ligase
MGNLHHKARMRAEMLQQRSLWSHFERRRAADAIAAHGLPPLGFVPTAVISGFASMPEELDALPLLARLHANGYRLCLPVIQGRGRPLLFRAWVPGDDMAVGQWGIREPKPEKPVLEPDGLLVPLLAFDKHGFRLGYGGGYYDRTLKDLRSRKLIVAIGLAFDEQEVDSVPHLDYDERLDWVLTPSGPRQCRMGEG